MRCEMATWAGCLALAVMLAACTEDPPVVGPCATDAAADSAAVDGLVLDTPGVDAAVPDAAADVAPTADGANDAAADAAPDAADATDSVDAVPPCGPVTAEACNGIDDDCDGATDETTCDDGNPCTQDVCDAIAGSRAPICHHAAAPGPCSDGNACSGPDACAGGACAAGAATVCNDGNPCTDDACAPASGCSAVANTGACDDGNPCTSGDACTAAKCLPGKQIVCNDGNPCTFDVCDPASGCTSLPNAVSCTDNNVCTKPDQCQAGVCIPGAALTCNDGNPCTTDACVPATGCDATPNTLPCDDGNVCTALDACVLPAPGQAGSGKCGPGKPMVCSDGNPCTDDACAPGVGCTALPNAATCTDANVCTTGDACSGGTCVPGKAAACADDNPCTTDPCDPKAGCSSVANALPCDDGSPCTVADACLDGACKPGKPQACSDGNACTDDACDAKSGCVAVANAAACNDGNACTAKDACKNSACGGSAVVCDDGNGCTNDFCDPAQGCTAIANAAACTDGDACTAQDQCAAGKCLGVKVDCNDGLACTDDTCAAKTGCVALANQATCTDGNACTVGDGCQAAACVPGGVNACDDGSVCTDDTCDPVKGCLFTVSNAFCTTDLVAHYHFAEGQGTQAADSSGKGHTLTLIGGGGWQDGWNDQAPKFSGDPTWAQAASTKALQVGQVTLEARVLVAAATGGYQMAVSKHLDYRLGVTPGLVPFGSVRLGGNKWFDFSGGAALLPGVWEHLALTYDGVTERLYVDGVQVAETWPGCTGSGPCKGGGGKIAQSNEALNIGRSSEGAYGWHGAVDEVRVFAVARTPTQVLADATLLVHYRYDEGQGKGTADASGNGFTPQLLGGVSWTPAPNGTALQFDGKSAIAKTKMAAGLLPTGKAALTVATRLRWMAANCGVVHVRPYWILHLACPGTASGMSWFLGNGAWQSIGSPKTYPADTWHHFTGVWDGTAMRLYVDGAQVASQPFAGPLKSTDDGNGQWLVVGKDYDDTSNVRWFHGAADDVRVYSRALGPAEVQAVADGL